MIESYETETQWWSYFVHSKIMIKIISDQNKLKRNIFNISYRHILVITHKSLIQRFSRIIFKAKDDQTLISYDFVMWDLFLLIWWNVLNWSLINALKNILAHRI